MDDAPETNSRSSPLIFAAIVFAIAMLPAAYLLSIGPAHWLRWNYYLAPATYNGYIAPVEFVAVRIRPLNDAVASYVALFGNKHWRN